jgi:signal transduction histidine kinase
VSWRRSFVGFALALLLGLSGVTCLSVVVVERDRAEAHAVRRATLEENVRLALWRMDSELAPLIANESARSTGAYYVRSPADIPVEDPPYVMLHFQISADGVTSPEVGPPHLREVAVAFVGSDRFEARERRLAELREKIGYDALAGVLDMRREALGREGLAGALALGRENPQYQGQSSWSAPVQSFKNAAEYGARSKIAKFSREYNTVNNEALEAGYFDALGPPAEAAMLPVWVGSQLVLARRATAGAGAIQGAWLDWEALEKKLLADVADLLPSARLVPIPGDVPVTNRALASLPVRLEPGDLPLGPVTISGEVIAVLVMAWAGILAAVGAFGGLLFGAVSLSERRGAFVSAVTHELRTPLTTFRMYTEMLSEGMIQDEAKKKRYLDTLRKEAVRLGHLVENVLAYAQIERGRARAQPETITVQAIYDRFIDRLRDRASQAGMTVAVELAPEDAALGIHVDVAAVDQILFNLIDNACKYASQSTDQRILLSATRSGANVELTVEDHGSGIPEDVRKRLFEPFSKSAHQAANSAPGVGLGLALSRRLARAMRGDLRYDDRHGGGARFIVSFPASS